MSSNSYPQVANLCFGQPRTNCSAIIRGRQKIRSENWKKKRGHSV